MKVHRLLVLKVLLVAGILSPALSTTHSFAAVSHTDHADYVGSGESLYGRCAKGTTPVNIGRVCFTVRSTDRRVDISSEDTVLGEAGMWYYLRGDGLEGDAALGASTTGTITAKFYNT